MKHNQHQNRWREGTYTQTPTRKHTSNLPGAARLQQGEASGDDGDRRQLKNRDNNGDVIASARSGGMSGQRGGGKEASPEGGERDNLEIIHGYGEKNNLIRAGKQKAHRAARRYVSTQETGKKKTDWKKKICE